MATTCRRRRMFGPLVITTVQPIPTPATGRGVVVVAVAATVEPAAAAGTDTDGNGDVGTNARGPASRAAAARNAEGAKPMRPP